MGDSGTEDVDDLRRTKLSVTLLETSDVSSSGISLETDSKWCAEVDVGAVSLGLSSNAELLCTGGD
jgi:hypothetical protein